MSTVINATFDGSVFRPTEPVALAPNTSVRLTVEKLSEKTGEPYSFLHLARSLNLEGPVDWSENLDEYLYGERCRD